MSAPNGSDKQSIFDLLNFSNAVFRESKDEQESYRYYACKPEKEAKVECKLVEREAIVDILRKSPSTSVMPIKKVYPQGLDSMILSYAFEAKIDIIQ